MRLIPNSHNLESRRKVKKDRAMGAGYKTPFTWSRKLCACVRCTQMYGKRMKSIWNHKRQGIIKIICFWVFAVSIHRRFHAESNDELHDGGCERQFNQSSKAAWLRTLQYQQQPHRHLLHLLQRFLLLSPSKRKRSHSCIPDS